MNPKAAPLKLMLIRQTKATITDIMTQKLVSSSKKSGPLSIVHASTGTVRRFITFAKTTPMNGYVKPAAAEKTHAIGMSHTGLLYLNILLKFESALNYSRYFSSSSSSFLSLSLHYCIFS